MLVLHHLNNSRSQRVLWTMEELDLKYEIQLYERDKKTMRAPAALRKVHPLGRSPILEDQIDSKRIVLAESGAILEYLVDRYGKGKLRPTEGSEDWIQYRFWMHFAEGSMMFPLLLKLIMEQVEKAPFPFFVKPMAFTISKMVQAIGADPELKKNLDLVEAQFKANSWLAGKEFSAADIQMSFPLEAADVRGLLGDRPGILDYLVRIRSRPAYQRALKVGGPFELGFK